MTASYRDIEAAGIASARQTGASAPPAVLAQAAPDRTGRAPRKPVTEGLR
jgi:hypothetical protein